MSELMEEVSGIVRGARRLREQFARGPSLQRSDDSDPTEEVVARWLGRWCDRASAGDTEAFAARLGWDGLDVDRARRTLGMAPASDESLPRWSETLLAVHDAARADLPWRGRSDGEPIPFEDVLAPAVGVASARLAACAASGVRLLAPARSSPWSGACSSGSRYTPHRCSRRSSTPSGRPASV